MELSKEIAFIRDSLISIFDIEKIIVFGVKRSEKDGQITDVDVCVVGRVDSDKNAWLKKAYLEIDCETPFDLFLYTPEEWAKSIQDGKSFASRIVRKGRVVYEKNESTRQ